MGRIGGLYIYTIDSSSSFEFTLWHGRPPLSPSIMAVKLDSCKSQFLEPQSMEIRFWKSSACERLGCKYLSAVRYGASVRTSTSRHPGITLHSREVKDRRCIEILANTVNYSKQGTPSSEINTSVGLWGIGGWLPKSPGDHPDLQTGWESISYQSTIFWQIHDYYLLVQLTCRRFMIIISFFS